MQTTLQVHRSKFFEWIPAGVQTLALNPASTRLAVGRSNGDVEIWGTDDLGLYITSIIPAAYPTSNVRSLSFIGAASTLATLSTERLFSAGLDGIVIEYDLGRLTLKQRSDSYGGAVWCIAASPDEKSLALACHDGCVRLFDISDGKLEFLRTFPRLGKGKLLSVIWSTNGKLLITGSSDGLIRTWDVSKLDNPRSISTMEAETSAGASRGKGKKREKRKSKIWALAWIQDDPEQQQINPYSGTIVSGDSLGNTSFWDARTSTLLQAFKKHEADILTIAVLDLRVPRSDGNTTTTSSAHSRNSSSTLQVFSSGVDHKVANFQFVSNNQNNTASSSSSPPTLIPHWVYTSAIRHHSHDITSLVVSNDGRMLITGSVDTRLNLFSAINFLNDPSMRLYVPFPLKPLVCTATSKRLILCQFPRKLEVWRLSATAGRGNADPPQKLVEMSMSEDSGNLISSAISPDGRYIACADQRTVKLFRLVIPSESSISSMLSTTSSSPPSTSTSSNTLIRVKKKSLDIKKTKEVPNIGSATCVLFTADSKSLILATRDQMVLVILLSKSPPAGSPRPPHRILWAFAEHQTQQESSELQIGSGVQSGTIQTLAVSSNGRWLASGDSRNTIHIFDLVNGKLQATLPIWKSQHVNFAFKDEILVVILARANQFYLFDVEEKRLTDWSREFSNKLPRDLIRMKDRLFGIAFDPGSPSLMFLYSHTYFCVIDLKKPVPKSCFGVADPTLPSGGASKQTAEFSNALTKDSPSDQKNFKLITRYGPIVYMDFFGKGVMLLIERPWQKINLALPPPLQRDTFGM